MGDLDVVLAQPEAQLATPMALVDVSMALRPNEHEERLWLRQQHFPSDPLARVMAFHLAGDLEPARLEVAITTVLRDMPGLDMRYRFDDDGELRKVPAAASSPQLVTHPVHSRAQALSALLAEQGRPWDLEAEAPLRFRLFSLGQDEAVLGVVVHRILDGGLSWGQIFANLARVCDGAAVVSAQDAIAVPGLSPEGAGLSWLRRPRAPDTLALTDYSRESWLEPGIRDRAGARYGCALETATLLRQTHGDTSPRALLAAATVLFGRFLLQLGGGQELKLTVIENGAELGLPLTTLAPLRLRLASDAPPEESVRHLLAGGESCAGSTAGHGIEVTWLAEDADVLALPGLVARRLPLPSLDTGTDLALGLALSADGRVAVELATGPEISPTAGAFLLERFAAFANGEETASAAFAVSSEQNRPIPQAKASGQQHGDVVDIILDEFRLALDIPDMGADDDFFDFGGHSLIATRVIGRLLGSHGIEVRINDLFGSPTAASLARHARHRADTAALPTAPAKAAMDEAPLSLAQQSLWKVYSAFEYGDIFNIPFALRFLAPVDESAFERAFLDLMERHPVLRSLFSDRDGTARQVVVPMTELERYKWFWSSRESEGLADRNREAGHRFDLTRELPLRLRFMIDEANGQQVLSLLFQHVILDEWSVNLLMDELEHAYRQRVNGETPQWQSLPPPFHQFAAKQRSAGLNASHVAYWTERLRGVAMGQPLFPRTADATAAASNPAGGWVELKLDSATVDGLYALAKNNGASLFNVVYAAIATSLHFLGAPDDLAIGTSASGRTDAEFFDTVGYFTTVVCHRLRIAADVTVAGLVRQVRDTVNESMPYSDIPIDLVEESLGFDSIASGGHMFGVFIQLHAKNKLNGAFTLADGRRVEFRQVDPDKSESLLGLHYEVLEETIDGKRVIRVMMSYRADLYDMEQVEAIRRTTCQLFSRFATIDATQPLASLRPAD